VKGKTSWGKTRWPRKKKEGAPSAARKKGDGPGRFPHRLKRKMTYLYEKEKGPQLWLRPGLRKKTLRVKRGRDTNITSGAAAIDLSGRKSDAVAAGVGNVKTLRRTRERIQKETFSGVEKIEVAA